MGAFGRKWRKGERKVKKKEGGWPFWYGVLTFAHHPPEMNRGKEREGRH